MKQQEGFTLIELMIVVAIITILAAFAVPAYFGYVKQAKVAEASVLFAGFKTNLAVWYATKSVWPTFQELKNAGIVYKGAYVEGTYDDAMATAGTPRVCFSVIGFDAGKDSIGWKYVSKIPGTDPWSCKMPDSGCTTIDNIYLPPNCI